MRKLLVFSYFSGFSARVTSEWIEDRLRVCESLGIKVTIVTSPQSALRSKPGLRVVKVPSLSLADFLFEVQELRANGGANKVELFKIALWMPMAATLGLAFDAVFKLLAGSRSAGMYSWALTATMAGLALNLGHRLERIYATGGPSSAQVAGTMVGLLTRTPAYLEFQDPFIGSEMHVNSNASFALKVLEKFFANYATQVTMVTEVAGSDFASRHPQAKAVIRGELPGSWDFCIKPAPKDACSSASEFLITHLGTLYGERNLDRLFEAIDLLPGDFQRRIVVQNVGGIFLENAQSYRSRPNFREFKYMPRERALEFAAQSDALLLVQHRDSRSHETIPYKTYDYLNLRLPILALVDNRELSRLITDVGSISSDVYSAQTISKELLKFFRGSDSRKPTDGIIPNVHETFKRLIGI